MALRTIVLEGDPILTKKCREITKFDLRLHELLDDMAETMYHAKGVGLAAPQVGFLKRVAIVDVGDGLVELINPIVVEHEGERREAEGCLSYPGKSAVTIRPRIVKITAFDRDGNKFDIAGKDLKAQAFCHEIDHLDGISFLERAVSIPRGGLGLRESFK